MHRLSFVLRYTTGLTLMGVMLLISPIIGAQSTQIPQRNLINVFDSINPKQWHIPAAGDEAIFVGQPAADKPAFVIKKMSFTEDPLTLRVTSDATQCVLVSSEHELSFPITPGNTVRLTLDGQADRPRLLIDGQESPALRGRWLALVLRSGEPTVTVRLQGATYATIRRGETTARVRRYVAMHPGGPLTLIEQEKETGSKQVAVDASRHQAAKQENLIGPDAPYWKPFVRAGVDFLTAYFYQGIGQEDNELIVQPWTEVTINMIQGEPDSWLDGVDLQVLARSSHHFGETGNNPFTGREKFYELDFRGGVTAYIFERWSMELAYLFRVAINKVILDVQQLEFPSGVRRPRSGF